MTTGMNPKINDEYCQSYSVGTYRHDILFPAFLNLETGRHQDSVNLMENPIATFQITEHHLGFVIDEYSILETNNELNTYLMQSSF